MRWQSLPAGTKYWIRVYILRVIPLTSKIQSFHGHFRRSTKSKYKKNYELMKSFLYQRLVPVESGRRNMFRLCYVLELSPGTCLAVVGKRWWRHLVADPLFLWRCWPKEACPSLVGLFVRDDWLNQPCFLPAPRSVMGRGCRALSTFMSAAWAGLLSYAEPLVSRHGLLLVRLSLYTTGVVHLAACWRVPRASTSKVRSGQPHAVLLVRIHCLEWCRLLRQLPAATAAQRAFFQSRSYGLGLPSTYVLVRQRELERANQVLWRCGYPGLYPAF